MSVAEIPTSVLLHDGLVWSLDALRLLALPVLIALPGLALGRKLLPERAAPWSRLTWGLGAGIACYILGRVLFQALGVADPRVWVAVLVVGSLVVLLRSPPFKPQSLLDELPVGVGNSRRQTVLLVLAAAITTGAVVLGRAGAAEASQKAYTEFWAVPDPRGLLVGIRNREGEATGYRVEMRQGQQIRAQWVVPPMPNGAADEHRFTPRPAKPGTDNDDWQILLYRAGDPQVYRHVTFKR